VPNSPLDNGIVAHSARLVMNIIYIYECKFAKSKRETLESRSNQGSSKFLNSWSIGPVGLYYKLKLRFEL
jgi:hypothetical protein